MKKSTRLALRKSIVHWVEMRDHPEWAVINPEGCALCRKFNNNWINTMPEEADCVGCPIFNEVGGEGYCLGTPLDMAQRRLSEWEEFEDAASKMRWERAAQSEINFLKSLLPKPHHDQTRIHPEGTQALGAGDL